MGLSVLYEDPADRYVICTSTTRPSTPVEGTMIYETDTNLLHVFNTTWVQLAAGVPHTSVAQAVSSAGITTSATFVNFNNSVAVASFPVYRADTKVVVQAHTGVYNDDAGGLGPYEVAVNINSTDYVLFYGLGSANAKSGAIEIAAAAVPPGTYSVTLRKRRPTATGNVRDGVASAINSLVVMETF